MAGLKRIVLAAGMVGLVIGISGCGLVKDDNVHDVQTMSEAEVTRRVEQYAEQVAALIGGELVNPAVNSAPCEGGAGEMDEQIRYVQGAYQIPLAAEKHIETLARLRDEWRAKGWTITEDRTFPSGTQGGLAVTTNEDGYSISLTSTTPPNAFALLIHSTCYRSAD